MSNNLKDIKRVDSELKSLQSSVVTKIELDRMRNEMLKMMVIQTL